MRNLPIVIFLLSTSLVNGCSKEEPLQELPPLERPLQAPPPLIEVVSAIENAVVILKDQNGQVVSDVVDTDGLTVRVEFNYTGSAEPPAEEWTPVRKAVNIKVGKVSKKNGRFVTFSSTVGRIQKVGKNSYAVESPITQSLKPNDYLVRGKLIKTKKYKGGDFVESSLTVIPAEDKVIE